MPKLTLNYKKSFVLHIVGAIIGFNYRSSNIVFVSFQTITF